MDERNRNPFASASGGAGGTVQVRAPTPVLVAAWRIQRMIRPLHHTPRVNNQIPDLNDATLDHELLSVRLATYGLAELQMEWKLPDQLFRNPDYHKHVRKHIVKQVLSENHSATLFLVHKFRVDSCPEVVTKTLFSFVVNSSGRVEKATKVIRRICADEIQTLHQEDEKFKAKICLVTSFREQSYIEILPHNKNPLREAWLSFWSEVHYNSLYSSGGKDSFLTVPDVPTRQYRKKHWLF
ncbi:hypothetical protein YC2023_061088 [Brassica napus]